MYQISVFRYSIWLNGTNSDYLFRWPKYIPENKNNTRIFFNNISHINKKYCIGSRSIINPVFNTNILFLPNLHLQLKVMKTFSHPNRTQILITNITHLKLKHRLKLYNYQPTYHLSKIKLKNKIQKFWYQKIIY